MSYPNYKQRKKIMEQEIINQLKDFETWKSANKTQQEDLSDAIITFRTLSNYFANRYLNKGTNKGFFIGFLIEDYYHDFVQVMLYDFDEALEDYYVNESKHDNLINYTEDLIDQSANFKKVVKKIKEIYRLNQTTIDAYADKHGMAKLDDITANYVGDIY